MRCPRCKNRVLQKSGSAIRLRTSGPISFDDQGVAHANCYWCKEPVELPLELRKSAEVYEERLFVRGKS